MEFDIPSRYEFGWMQARFTELHYNSAAKNVMAASTRLILQ